MKIYASDLRKDIESIECVFQNSFNQAGYIRVYLSEGKSKLVPVRFQGKVTAGLQYYVSDTICNPDSVLVYAPEGILDTITTAYTQKINLENISDTTRRRIPLNSFKSRSCARLQNRHFERTRRGTSCIQRLRANASALRKRRLIVDIGGASTELIIGQGLEADRCESFRIGCVNTSIKFFRDGRLSAKAIDRAVLACQAELEESIRYPLCAAI